MDPVDTAALDDFVSILKFMTVSSIGASSGSYDECSNWLVHKLQSSGINNAFILPESLPHKPIVIGVIEGDNKELPAILLNSHYDVVPVANEYWTVPAFEGYINDGKIYGRGTQDMKCVCVQYIHSLKRLLNDGFKPKRNIYLSFVPDEEIGGYDGMKILLESNWYANINISIAFDEGLASEDDNYTVFYAERLPWWVKYKAEGNTGHASRFIENTAVEQIVSVANKALAFRKEQKDILHGGVDTSNINGCSHCVAKKKTLGDVTTLNLTSLHASVTAGNGVDVLNVVPPTAEASFDIRISPHVDPSEVHTMLDNWCHEVNSSMNNAPNVGIKWEFVGNPLKTHSVTSVDPKDNKWFTLLTDTLAKKNITINTQVFPAATDSRYLRALNIKALGFSPIRNSKIMLHENDEYIDINVYLEGIQIYYELIKVLASQDEL